MAIAVSFLIPSFNHEKYILELLESVKDEVLSLSAPSEIVVVDDCSADESRRLILEWVIENGKYFSILFLPSDTNRGIAATLNELIVNASGEYFRLCSSDDVIIKGSTGELLNEFHKNESLLCCFGDAVVINEMGGVISESSIDFHGGNVDKLSSPETLPSELIKNWCLAGPSSLIKKKFYKNMQYDEILRIDDYDLYLTLLGVSDSLSFINKKVCLYRIHNNNTSKTKNKNKRIENLNSFLFIVNKHLQIGKLNRYLVPVKFETEAKINFLKSRYTSAIFSIIKYFFVRLK